MAKKKVAKVYSFERIVEILRDLELIKSPSGHTDEVIAHIEKIARDAGIDSARTNKGALLVSMHKKCETVIAGHVDTLGAMVSFIKADGTLAFTPIGGPLWPSFEGNYVTVVTGENAKYTGTILLNNPAAHVNREAGKTERKPDSMHVRLDLEARSKKDVEKHGIGIGDFICFEPRFEFTSTGFVKSHFLDDKAGAAAMIDAFLSLGPKKLAKLPIAFFFSNFEEVGHGACAGLPECALEMLVVDMGVVGDNVEGDEFSVSICAKDSTGPYDFAIREELRRLAKKKKIPFKVDVFPFYGSDGSAALHAGYNIRVGLIGPGVSASHGNERTHIKGLRATRDLIIAYATR